MLWRFLTGSVLLAGTALIVLIVFQSLEQQSRQDEARALLARNIQLIRMALAPRSPLACLEGNAGDRVETECEAAIFGSPTTIASALSYVAERLAILKAADDLSRHGISSVVPQLASERRAFELDRYGLGAHVLAEQDGCTPNSCAAFAILRDTTVLKINLQGRAFESYVALYSPRWPKQSNEPAPAQVTASKGEPSAAAVSAKPLDDRWNLPSAASIPSVSIMTPEPGLPKPLPEAPHSVQTPAKSEPPKVGPNG